MKFLILGSNGMVGHMLALYFLMQGYNVIGFARKASNIVQTIIGDVCNKDNLQEIIANNHFDIIVNCIGILNKSAEQNKEKAVFVNSLIPHTLAELTENTTTQIIQISTDCVFSGNRGGVLRI